MSRESAQEGLQKGEEHERFEPFDLDIVAKTHNFIQDKQASASCNSKYGPIRSNLVAWSGAQMTPMWAILGSFSALAVSYAYL